ncbi:MAG: glycosyltransferase family 2 protein [Planctomycetes bacterium]|nr:glycosyltransferase family 2 protein [Planctomycetota bacterium]
MKLIIQIPCFNEQDTLAEVVGELPRELPGIDLIEYLVIDDGSADRTAELARELGVHHVLNLGSNRGLATAFLMGVRRCLELGADIIVNTDGDNQYHGGSVKDLIVPVLENKADIVVGARPIEMIDHFTWWKKKLQRWGSRVVRKFSGTNLPDTTSGFRAYSAEAALRLHVFNQYTYTLETIIQAGHMNMRITHVPIEVNPKTRDSRLIKSVPRYIWLSGSTILRSYLTYKPLRTFFYLSLPPGLIGLGICLWWLIVWGSGHMQALLLGVMLILIAFLMLVLGVVSDLMSANRKLIQELLYSTRSKMYKNPPEQKNKNQ